MLNGVENPQPGVCTIARQQKYLYFYPVFEQLIQTQQFLHQGKGHAGFQDLVFTLDLVVTISIHTLLLEYLVRGVQVKQGPR